MTKHCAGNVLANRWIRRVLWTAAAAWIAGWFAFVFILAARKGHQ